MTERTEESAQNLVETLGEALLQTMPARACVVLALRYDKLIPCHVAIGESATWQQHMALAQALRAVAALLEREARNAGAPSSEVPS